MDNKEKIYRKTKLAYKKLGDDYINWTKNLSPKEFCDFVKNLSKGGIVLDAGCAGGRDSKRFIQKGFRVIGIDNVDYFIKIAKQNVPEGKFIKKDLFKIKFPSNHFDGIWASNILLHLKREDLTKAIKILFRVLKEGGIIYISVRKGKEEGFHLDESRFKEKRWYTYFSKNEIIDSMKKVGFRVIRLKITKDDGSGRDIEWIRIIAQKA